MCVADVKGAKTEAPKELSPRGRGRCPYKVSDIISLDVDDLRSQYFGLKNVDFRGRLASLYYIYK